MRSIIILAVGLSACSPRPRDAGWFEANPDVAAKVVTACEAGARSAECENARSGLAGVKARARMERYRRGFE